MSKFRQTLTAYYEVIVEADDMYAADEKVSSLSYSEIVDSGNLTYIDFDTQELPEEC